MTVTLDVDRTWKVGCDTEAMCAKRLYLTGDTELTAAEKARDEYGWQIVEGQVYCPTHGSPR